MTFVDIDLVLRVNVKNPLKQGGNRVKRPSGQLNFT